MGFYRFNSVFKVYSYHFKFKYFLELVKQISNWCHKIIDSLDNLKFKLSNNLNPVQMPVILITSKADNTYSSLVFDWISVATIKHKLEPKCDDTIILHWHEIPVFFIPCILHYAIQYPFVPLMEGYKKTHSRHKKKARVARKSRPPRHGWFSCV